MACKREEAHNGPDQILKKKPIMGQTKYSRRSP